MSSSRKMRSSSDCRTIVKKFDWNDLNISHDMVKFGEDLETLASLSVAEKNFMNKDKLFEKFSDLSKAYKHAVSGEVAAPEDESKKKNKDEARVATRVAIAASAASAKGLSEAEKETTIADAVAKEREVIAARAKAEVEAKQAEIDTLKQTAEAAEKARNDAETDAAEKDAKHKQYVAEKETELQNTRARALKAENAKANVDAHAKGKRKAAKSAQAGEGAEVDADGGNAPVAADPEVAAPENAGALVPAAKKRKTADERKDEFVQKGKGTEEEWESQEKAKKETAAATRLLKLGAEVAPDVTNRWQAAERRLGLAGKEIEALEDKNELLKDKKKALANACRRLMGLCKSKGVKQAAIDMALGDVADNE